MKLLETQIIVLIVILANVWSNHKQHKETDDIFSKAARNVSIVSACFLITMIIMQYLNF